MRRIGFALIPLAVFACKHEQQTRPNGADAPDGGFAMGLAQAGDGGVSAAEGMVEGTRAAVAAAADGGSAFAAGMAGAAGADAGAVEEQSFRIAAAPPLPAIPQGLHEVGSPEDNPTTADKVHLGHQLFFDKRLSKDGSMSCESCHHPEKAWTSGNVVDAKVGGAKNKRNSPSIQNLGFQGSFYWDGRKPTLEAVSEAAWTGQLGAKPEEIAAALNKIPQYRAEFLRAFKEDASAKNVPQALAAFFRALMAADSPWDRFEKGDAKAVSKEVQHGFEVFTGARCTLCHVPPTYSDSDFHNAGVGSDKPDAERDHGRMDATKDAKDDGKFKTPSLRDVAKTGPYFHDGSVATLKEAIDLMVAGGKKNPHLDEKLKPAKLSKKDRAALEAFLESLSGTSTLAQAPALP